MLAVANVPGFFEPCASILHLVGAGAVARVGGALVRTGRDRNERAALWVFVAAASLLLGFSGLYHSLEPGPLRDLMQRLDHAAIWLLIAATFTGMHAVAFRGPWRERFLGVVWIAALAGMVLEAWFFETIAEGLVLSFYLGLGWLGILSCWALRHHPPRVLLLLFVGGGAYTLGALYDFAHGPALVDGLVDAHALFHATVLVGVACHWLVLLRLTEIPVVTAAPQPRPRLVTTAIPVTAG
jgi:hemolysin III